MHMQGFDKVIKTKPAGFWQGQMVIHTMFGASVMHAELIWMLW